MTRVSAPGKLILAGEHAAVYGRPALVAAVGARTWVTLSEDESGTVRLVLPDMACEESTTWTAVEAHGDRARTAWEAYRQAPGPARLASLTTADPAHVVKVALAETVRHLGLDPDGVRVEVRSELPVGAGFGSSASVAVATIGALSRHSIGRIDPSQVAEVALEVERRQHGRPSGADHTTVLHGGVQWFERGGDGRLQRVELPVGRSQLAGLAVFHTGSPAEGTGEMVESVRRRFASRAEELEDLLDALESATRRLRAALVDEDTQGIEEILTRYEGGLERLGVVPQAVRESIRAVEAAGGAAKISGAGALSGTAAGALLAYSGGDEAPLDVLAAYQRLEVELAAPGLRVERDLEVTVS